MLRGGVAERLKAPVLKTYSVGYGGLSGVTPGRKIKGFCLFGLSLIMTRKLEVGIRWASEGEADNDPAFVANTALERTRPGARFGTRTGPLANSDRDAGRHGAS